MIRANFHPKPRPTASPVPHHEKEKVKFPGLSPSASFIA